MLDTIIKAVFIVFFFGFCVFIHEFGHLLVAIWRGLHVEKFSIGMGPRLCGFKWRGIEFIVSWLPFGGYVSLPQLDPTDAPKTSEGKELPPSSPGARAATAFAGPLFNVLFGFLLATVMYFAGLWMPTPASSVVVLDVPKTIKTDDSKNAEEQPNPEWEAGLRPGDRIVAINGKSFSGGKDEFQKEYVYSNGAQLTVDIIRDGVKSSLTYNVLPNTLRENLGFPFFDFENPVQVREIQDGVLKDAGISQGDLLLALNGHNITTVRAFGQLLAECPAGASTLAIEREGKMMELQVTLPGELEAASAFQRLGISFGATVLEVLEDTPAATTGIRPGDCFSAVERLDAASGETLSTTAVYDITDFQQTVRQSNGAPLRFTLKRGNQTMQLTATPVLGGQPDAPVWQIGIILSDGLGKQLSHPSPWSQFSSVIGTTARTLGLLFSPITSRLKAAVTRQPRQAPAATIGLKHMSGPGGILMMLWYKIKEEGYRGGFAFIILITFSLAFMNLLPLPVLDGGHIVFAALEAITHRRLPAKLLSWIYNIFACLLIALMLYITVFDGKRAWRIFRLSHPADTKAQEAAPQQAEETQSEPQPQVEEMK